MKPLGGAIRLYTRDRRDTGAGLFVEGSSFGIPRQDLRGGVKIEAVRRKTAGWGIQYINARPERRCVEQTPFYSVLPAAQEGGGRRPESDAGQRLILCGNPPNSIGRVAERRESKWIHSALT
jgi:hypothetical protein